MAFVELHFIGNEFHDEKEAAAGELKNEKLGPGSYLWVKKPKRKLIPKAKAKPKNENTTPAFCWKLATVISRRHNIITVKEGHSLRTLDLNSDQECLPFESNRKPIDVEDLTKLEYPHKPGILHVLKKRALAKLPYTFIANVLISVNPLRKVPEPVFDNYEEGVVDYTADLPPHPRTVAERAYHRMVFTSTQRLRLMDLDHSRDRSTKLAPSGTNLIDKESPFSNQYGLLNQTIVISGESGSGKTEAAKKVLRQLIEREKGDYDDLDDDSELEDEAEDDLEFQERLFGSSMLLECLGNATTKQNPNSSRFGSMLQLYYEPTFQEQGDPEYFMYGAKFTTYLLERSRVSHQNIGERNFNVFYQLLTSPNKNLQNWLGFKKAQKKFRYLKSRFQKEDEDRAGYSKLRTALSMANLGVRNAFIFEVIAAILHLGNIDFEEVSENGETKVKIKSMHDDVTFIKKKKKAVSNSRRPSIRAMKKKASAQLVNSRRKSVKQGPTRISTKTQKSGGPRRNSVRSTKISMLTTTTGASQQKITRINKHRDTVAKPYSPFNRVCKMLVVNEKTFESLLTRKVVKIRKETITTYYTLAEAEQKRDAIARFLYFLLFEWIVERINKAFSDNPDAENSNNISCIGILDIFGFENFKVNSLEQLLINYANELLLSLFVKEVIIEESVLYRNEGLIIKEGELGGLDQQVDSYQMCINLFEGKPRKFEGILKIIDSQQSVPEPSDEKLLVRLQTRCKSSDKFMKVHPSKMKSMFAIKHYSSPVEYTITEFLLKNDQRLPENLLSVLQQSQQKVIKQFRKLRPARTAAMAVKEYTKSKLKKHKEHSTVCAVFRNQLSNLKEVLDKTGCHYIRCVKPNPTSFIDHGRNFIEDSFDTGGQIVKPLIAAKTKFNARKQMKKRRATIMGSKSLSNKKTYFNVDYVSQQLDTLGIYDCVSVLKCGLPTRLPYSAFTVIFEDIVPLDSLPYIRSKPLEYRQRLYVLTLMQAFNFGPGSYRLGLTKIFFPPGELESFRELLSKAKDNMSAPKNRRKIKKKILKINRARFMKSVYQKIRIFFIFKDMLFRTSAAIKIQFVVRRYFKTKAKRKELREYSSAVLIQKSWRGYIQRVKYVELRRDAILEGFDSVESERWEDITFDEQLNNDLSDENNDIEGFSEFGEDEFTDTMESYFRRRTQLTRKTGALSTVMSQDKFMKFSSGRKSRSRRLGTVLSRIDDDEFWNADFELDLLEVDGERADPEFDPMTDVFDTDDEVEQELMEYDGENIQGDNFSDSGSLEERIDNGNELDDAAGQFLAPKAQSRKQEQSKSANNLLKKPDLEDTESKKAVNRMNPRRSRKLKKKRKTITLPEWKTIQLRSVKLEIDLEAPQAIDEDDGDDMEASVIERTQSAWNIKLKKV